MSLRIHLLCLLMLLVYATCAIGQTPSIEVKHFDGEIVFDYPASWILTSGKNKEATYDEFDAKDGSAQLIVYAWQGPFLRCSFENVRQQAASEFINRVAKQIHADLPLKTSTVFPVSQYFKADEVQIHGTLRDKPVTADVVSIAFSYTFVDLIYIRVDNNPAGVSAWETIGSTMRYHPPVQQATLAQLKDLGIINGKAVRLVKPSYPPTASAAHISGTVVVQVVINEAGVVTQACSLSGEPVLRQAAEYAAMHSTFTPTIFEGKAITVTGTINYIFQPR